MKLKSLFLILITSFSIFSCSSDDSTGPVEFDTNAKLEIVKVNATSVDLNYITSSFSNLAVGIRKEGETEFGLRTGYNTNNVTRDDLEPAQKYEMTLLVNGSDELKFDIIKFTTLPFDEAKGLTYHLYSERGYTHEIEPDVYNPNASLKFYLVGESDSNIKIELPHTYANGKIKFEMPNNTLSDEPYQEYQNYNFGYQVGEGSILLAPIPNRTSIENIVISVFNKNPFIESIIGNDSRSCQNTSIYDLRFKGTFFSSFDDARYPFEQTKAVITRIDNGAQFILDEESIECKTYERFSSPDFKLPTGIIKNHTSRTVHIKYPKSAQPNTMFAPGDYKIKITFSNPGNGPDDFYETNEFLFTLN